MFELSDSTLSLYSTSMATLLSTWMEVGVSLSFTFFSLSLSVLELKEDFYQIINYTRLDEPLPIGLNHKQGDRLKMERDQAVKVVGKAKQTKFKF